MRKRSALTSASSIDRSIIRSFTQSLERQVRSDTEESEEPWPSAITTAFEEYAFRFEAEQQQQHEEQRRQCQQQRQEASQRRLQSPPADSVFEDPAIVIQGPVEQVRAERELREWSEHCAANNLGPILTSRPSSWSSDESGVPFIQRRPRPGAVIRVPQRMDPQTPLTTATAADNSAATTSTANASAPASARTRTICICRVELEYEICRCVPEELRHLFLNQRVPDNTYFKSQWVYFFGHKYQLDISLPPFVQERFPELSPSELRRKVRDARARAEWRTLQQSVGDVAASSGSGGRPLWEEIAHESNITATEATILNGIFDGSTRSNIRSAIATAAVN